MKYFYGKHKVDGSWGFTITPDDMDDEVHSEFTELSEEYYNSLLEQQAQGLEIHNQDGYPVAKPHIATDEEKAAGVRSIRDQYLKSSDIEMLPDNWARKTAEQQTLWTDYRQYLRDIPQGTGFPDINVETFSDWVNNKSN